MKICNIQKMIEPIVRRPGCTSFAVIKDPGCEGLGTVMMKTYAGALFNLRSTGQGVFCI